MSVLDRPGLTGEQIDIGRTITEFFAEYSTEQAVRAAMATDSRIDLPVWSRLAELGIPGLAIPERYGGLGLGWTELSLVVQAAGEVLLCAPLLSSAVLATAVLLTVAEGAARAELLPGLADGSARLAVVAPTNGSDQVTVTALKVGEDTAAAWSLSGRVAQVIDGASANGLLVAATGPFGLAFFAVEADAPGLTRTPLTTLDLTRALATVELREVPARLISGADCAARWARCLDIARTMLAAEQVGGAERCLRTAVRYACDRVQFGRAIGSFQAIKHTCATMLIALEGARATMVEAVRVIETGDDAELVTAAALAGMVCSQAYFSIASDALHVHGGIGFTWEHSSHLYFRRAKSSELMLGTPDLLRERLLVSAGLAARGGAAA